MGCSLSVVLRKKNGSGRGGDGEKKEKGSKIIVLKVVCPCDSHINTCLKCVPKLECIIDFSRLRFLVCVETVKPENGSNKVTVVGAVDREAIVDQLQKKTNSKVELISTQSKKDDNKEEKKEKKTRGGVHAFKVDMQKELVTVKGTTDHGS
ncbi:hypothetical protein DITRI_Ditri05aG0012700 [Diplodiscus trichospermus]